jgi:hypothetical protein
VVETGDAFLALDECQPRPRGGEAHAVR